MTASAQSKDLLDRYAEHAGLDAVEQLRQLAEPLAGLRVVHVNSTRVGGGVAEILETLVPLMRALGLDASWEIIEGTEDFFACTKSFHNALQGKALRIPTNLLSEYERVNAQNAERMRPILQRADVVFVHDPQPAPLLNHFPDRTGKWIWRCHIDLSHPYRPVWNYVRQFVVGYDASIATCASTSRSCWPLDTATSTVSNSVRPAPTTGADERPAPRHPTKEGR